MINLNIMKTGIRFATEEEQKTMPVIPFVDDTQSWLEPNDWIIKHGDGFLQMPVSKIFDVEPGNIDLFVLATKRCYNNEKLRTHTTLYLNYFLKYFDTEYELLTLYANIKFIIDTQKYNYKKEVLFSDIMRYFLSPSMMWKIRSMNRYNYSLNLRAYTNKKEPGLQYTDKHGMLLMEISLIFNIILPILTHYCAVNKVENIDDFLLEMYDIVLCMYDVDIYNKLYETALSNVIRNKKKNPIWDMQDIRGTNTTTHTISTVENLIKNIIPKYVYNENIVNFNFRSILKNIGYQVTDIGYDFDYTSLSSSKRDEDNNSEFDKFESYLVKADEALYLQNKVNCTQTMKMIENKYGPFSDEEIDYYFYNLVDSGNEFKINSLQRFLVFNLFYNEFGDPMSIKEINSRDYIKLLISAKRLLQANKMVALPYVFSSKITKLVQRKNLNKKEQQKILTSEQFAALQSKYNNDKIIDIVFQKTATILSSEFKIIEFNDPELDGKTLECIPDIICEEMLKYFILV